MEEKVLEMFNKGESGFSDRDLYVFCANASDGLPLRKEIMQTATEGKIKEVTYW